MSNGFYVVPKLVEDTSLKRSRIELQDGSSAIKVSETTPADLSPVTDSLGKTGDAAWNGSDLNATVISLLKAVCDKVGPQIVVPVITQLSNINGDGPTSYTLNNPAGTYMNMSANTMSLAIGQDASKWYIQASTGSLYVGFVANPDLPFDDYRFAYFGSSNQQYAIQMKDSNNNVILQLADTSDYLGVATLIIPKTLLDFNLPYS